MAEFRTASADPLGRQAAAWVQAFQADIELAGDETTIVLRSNLRSRDELERLWRCALATERLHVRHAAQRGAVLAELVR